MDESPLTRLGGLLRRTGRSHLARRLTRDSAASIALRVTNTALSFAVAVLLARALGVDGYGIYSYVFALISIVAIPAKFGLPGLTVREVARAQAASAWGELRGMVRWGNAMAGTFTIVLVLVASGLAAVFAHRFTPVQLGTFAWGLALIPMMVLGELRGAALRGHGHVIQGQLPELILRPAFLCLTCLVLLAATSRTRLAPDEVMASHVLAAFFAFAIGAWLFFRIRPADARSAQPVYRHRAWLAAALPLALTAGIQFLNNHMDILILGLFEPAAEVGTYRAAGQLAALVSVALMAINQVVAPQFARLYASGDTRKLQRLASASARLSLVVAVPLAAMLIFLGDTLLVVLFGPEFYGGGVALAILAIGQLGNAAFGSVVMLLNMSGHEARTARGVALAAILNVILNLVLIPMLGLEGAAAATMLTMLLWNVILWMEVRRSLRINSAAFGPREYRT